MENTLIVTGPQGCGKTWHAAELMRRFGCSRVVDEWWPGDVLTPGALHLTNVPVSGRHLGVRVLQFTEIDASEDAPAEGARDAA